jgi:hypothetical protein
LGQPNRLAINLLVKFGMMLLKSTDSLLDRQREKDHGGEGGTPIRIPITT